MPLSVAAVALAFVLPRVAPPSPAARAVVLALDNLGDGDESEEVESLRGQSQSASELGHVW